MGNFDLSGTGVAIITPFRKDGSIDFHALDKLIEYQVENGIGYFVVMGTTGESVTLTDDEKEAVLSYIKERVAKRLPIVVGIGGNNTQSVINNIKNTNFEDVSALLSVAPYYNKPSQNGIFLHYKTIASVSPVPVIIYNVPGRTSVNIDADTTLKLANEVKNIIATKEASGDLAQIMEIIKNRPDGFKVISGDDALTLTMIMLGGDGVISVIANACPQEFSSMVKYALNGDCAKAREIHYQLLDLINALFEEGSPAGVKALLSMKGYIENSLRLPLTPISNELNQKIKNLI